MAISIGDAVLKVGVDKKDFDKKMTGIGASIKKHQKAIGIGMVAMGGTILAGLGISLKAAAAFEKAMREVNTMMGLSQDEFAVFSKQVRTLASDLGVDAVESANALYQAISAGIPEENVLEFLEIATKAAIGGVTDTATAVDGLTTVINAFKLPMSATQKVADIMFTTVKGGKTTFEELSATLFNVAPIAAASGVSFEEVSAALATMTKQGVPTAQATTQLRQAMVALQKPTADMDRVIKSLGYESGQTMLKELGLAETLNVLRDSTSGSNEQLMKMFGSVEAGGAVLALTGDNALTFADDLKSMENATGAATDAFNEMEESATRQMEALKSLAEGIAISVGNILLPILKKFLASVKSIIEKIKDWTDEHPKLTDVIVKTGLALGALLTVMGTLIVLRIPALIAGFVAVAKVLIFTVVPAIWAVVTAKWAWVTATLALMALTGVLIPVVILAVAGIALMATGIALLVNEQKKQYDSTNETAGAIKNLEETALEYWRRTEQTYGKVGEAIDSVNKKLQKQLKLQKELMKIVGRKFPKGLTTAELQLYAPLIEGVEVPGQVPGTAGYYKALGVAGFQAGGIINKPTLAMLGEKGPEAVVPLNKEGMVNIYVELDGRVIAKAVGQPLVDEIRLRTGVHI